MHNKFEEYTWKTFQVIAPTRSNYWRKRWKIAISRPFKKKNLAIIELVRELVISNMHNKFGKDTWKTFKLSRPQVNVNADADDAERQLQFQLH